MDAIYIKLFPLAFELENWRGEGKLVTEMTSPSDVLSEVHVLKNEMMGPLANDRLSPERYKSR